MGLSPVLLPTLFFLEETYFKPFSFLKVDFFNSSSAPATASVPPAPAPTTSTPPSFHHPLLQKQRSLVVIGPSHRSTSPVPDGHSGKELTYWKHRNK